MTEEELQVYARITVLEFVLEVMLANTLAQLDPSVSETFKRDLVSRPARLPPKSGPIDVDVFGTYQAQIAADLEHFLEKVAQREGEIRAKIAQAQQQQRS